MKSLTQFINESKVTDFSMYTLKINDTEYNFRCETHDTRSAWNHTVSLYVDDSFATSYRVTYYNRTWESWKYQSACIGVIEKWFGKAKKYADEKAAVITELRKDKPNFE